VSAIECPTIAASENFLASSGLNSGQLRILGMTQKQGSFDVPGQLPALRRYALVLTHHPAEAEELVHETLLRAYEKRASFRAGNPLRLWLLAILHNCFVDGIRRRQANHNALAITSRLSPDYQPAPQEQHVRLAQLQKSFMALPEDQRATLHLVAIEGLSYQEAASTLGIPVGTLMSRLGRARAALRALEDADGTRPTGSADPRKPQLRIVGGTNDASD
jgi:RNA polymerase sigma-70 factor (ECF subfamily)